MTTRNSPTDASGINATQFLSTMGDTPALAAVMLSTIGSNMAVAANNSGIFTRFRPRRDIVLTSLVWVVGSQSGNYDIGIFDSTGARLWSKGSTATPATGTSVAEAVTGVTLQAARTYYVGWSSDNTTSGVKGIAAASVGEMTKLMDGTPSVFSVASVFPLPSTVTLGSTAPNRLPFFSLRG